MFAIIDFKGHQYKVEPQRYIYVDRLKEEEGSEITIDKVLLVVDGDNIQIGTPTVEGASVKAKVLAHVKGDKIIIFKKKRRKGYKVKRGYRHQYTKLLITAIEQNG